MSTDLQKSFSSSANSFHIILANTSLCRVNDVYVYLNYRNFINFLCKTQDKTFNCFAPRNPDVQRLSAALLLPGKMLHPEQWGARCRTPGCNQKPEVRNIDAALEVEREVTMFFCSKLTIFAEVALPFLHHIPISHPPYLPPKITSQNRTHNKTN